MEELICFFTGIKVVDLLVPFAIEDKVGFFGGVGVDKAVLMMELINKITKVNEGYLIFVVSSFNL